MPSFTPDTAAFVCPECGSIAGRAGTCENHDPPVKRIREADELSEALELDERPVAS